MTPDDLSVSPLPSALTHDDLSSGTPSPPAFLGHINQRISKHAGGWSPRLVNGVSLRRWKARQHRRVLRRVKAG